MTAMGADPGAIMTNPAGMAIYRQSHFNVGLGQSLNHVNDGKQLSHIGYTWARQLGSRYGLAMSYQYARDGWDGFWSQYRNNPSESMVDVLLDQSVGAGAPEDLMGEGLVMPYAAYQGYILEYDDNMSEYFSLAEGNPSTRTQTYRMGYGGTRSMWGIALRGPKFSIGWSSMRENRHAYEALVVHESGYSGYTSAFTMRMSDTMSTSGTSQRLGVIARLDDGLQVAAYVSQPAYVTTRWEQTIRVTPETEMDDSAFELFDDEKWTNTSPLRFGVAASQTINNQGFASAEYHYSQFIDPIIIAPLAEVSAGYAISSELQGTHEIRVGGELRNGALAYRAGIRGITSGHIYEDHSALGQLSCGLGFIQESMQFNITASMTHRNASIIDPVTASPWVLNNSSLYLQAGVQFKI